MKSFVLVNFSPLNKKKYAGVHKWDGKTIGIEPTPLAKTKSGAIFKISSTWKFFQFKNNRSVPPFDVVRACDLLPTENVSHETKNYGSVHQGSPMIEDIAIVSECCSFLFY